MGRTKNEYMMNRALITGGGGFVGKALIRLLQKSEVECLAIGRSVYPELEEMGITCFRGDIADKKFILDKVKNVDVVFHVAALAGIWGSWDTYFRSNVVGTRNIIDACLENSIPVLVQTSTPSVVFNQEDIINGDEDLPYPSRFLCNYAKSKVIAEREVLAVNQRDLKTCAIRPHLIWGPDDPHLVPRLIDKGKKGVLKIVGDGSNRVDITYIDNVAHAHLLAAQNLLTTSTASANAYFVGQENPVRIWDWINELFQRLNIAQVKSSVSLKNALAVGTVLEYCHKYLFLKGEPRMTRFLAQQLAKSHYFSHKRAENDFGYKPLVSIEEGMDRLIYWLKSR